MKIRFFFLILSLSFAFGIRAQSGTVLSMPPIDKSPMDMAYYPADYPILKIRNKATEPLVARAIYSRPQKSGRTVWGELVEWNHVWRLGANEATEVEFFRDVKIGGKKVAKGKYTLYALVTPAQWTFILNRDTDTWGAFKYDEKKDVVRVAAPVQKLSEPFEAFTLAFEKTATGLQLAVAWDDARAVLPISLK